MDCVSALRNSVNSKPRRRRCITNCVSQEPCRWTVWSNYPFWFPISSRELVGTLNIVELSTIKLSNLPHTTRIIADFATRRRSGFHNILHLTIIIPRDCITYIRADNCQLLKQSFSTERLRSMQGHRRRWEHTYASSAAIGRPSANVSWSR